MLFKFKPACKQKLTVRMSPTSLVVIEYVCSLDANHPGAHCSKEGNKWVTNDRVQRFVEEHGESL